MEFLHRQMLHNLWRS